MNVLYRGGCCGGMGWVVLVVVLVLVLGVGSVWVQLIIGGFYGCELVGQVMVVVDNVVMGYYKNLQVDVDGCYMLGGFNLGCYIVIVIQGGVVVGICMIIVMVNVQMLVLVLSCVIVVFVVKVENFLVIQVSVIVCGQDVIFIDVSMLELFNSYNMSVVNQLFIGCGLESIVLLSFKVCYDNQIIGLVQMGGVSFVENCYYYNEFDSIYDYQGLGVIYLLVEVIELIQVLDFNVGVIWISIIGGVIVQIVCQGINQFKVGYLLYFSLVSLVFNLMQFDVYICQGVYYYYILQNSYSGNVIGQYLWGFGVLVKDKLFFFVMLGNVLNNWSVSYFQMFKIKSVMCDKNVLFNFIWNINVDQLFNVVGNCDWKDSFNNQYCFICVYDFLLVGSYYGWILLYVKNQFLIGNYYWQINDIMSLWLMVGYLSQLLISFIFSSGIGVFYVNEVDLVMQICINIGLIIISNQFYLFQYW